MGLCSRWAPADRAVQVDGLDGPLLSRAQDHAEVVEGRLGVEYFLILGPGQVLLTGGLQLRGSIEGRLRLCVLVLPLFPQPLASIARTRTPTPAAVRAERPL